MGSRKCENARQDQEIGRVCKRIRDAGECEAGSEKWDNARWNQESGRMRGGIRIARKKVGSQTWENGNYQESGRMCGGKLRGGFTKAGEWETGSRKRRHHLVHGQSLKCPQTVVEQSLNSLLPFSLTSWNGAEGASFQR